MEEILRQHLIEAAKAFEAASGVSLATIGRRALNDNTLLARLASGQGFTVKTYDRLLGWLSENWPDNAVWPEGVIRPEPAAPTADLAEAS